MARSNRARPGDLDYGAGDTLTAAQKERMKDRKAARKDRREGGSSKFDESKVKRGKGDVGGQFVAKAGGGDTSAEEAAVRRALNPSDQAGMAASIRAFQRRHGLKVDGVVGRQTALALAGKYNKARKTTPGVMDESVSKLLRQRHQAKSGTKANRREKRALFGTGGRSGGGRVVESAVDVLEERDIDWDESMVNRDRRGRFAEKAGGLTPPRVAGPTGIRLPDGTRISRDADGTLRVVRRNRMHTGFTSVDAAVRDALDRSARGEQPESIGGVTRYSDYESYLRAQGVEPESGGDDLAGRLERAQADLRAARASDSRYAQRRVASVEATVADLERRIRAAGRSNPGAEQNAAANRRVSDRERREAAARGRVGSAISVGDQVRITAPNSGPGVRQWDVVSIDGGIATLRGRGGPSTGGGEERRQPIGDLIATRRAPEPTPLDLSRDPSSQAAARVRGRAAAAGARPEETVRPSEVAPGDDIWHPRATSGVAGGPPTPGWARVTHVRRPAGGRVEFSFANNPSSQWSSDVRVRRGGGAPVPESPAARTGVQPAEDRNTAADAPATPSIPGASMEPMNPEQSAWRVSSGGNPIGVVVPENPQRSAFRAFRDGNSIGVRSTPEHAGRLLKAVAAVQEIGVGERGEVDGISVYRGAAGYHVGGPSGSFYPTATQTARAVDTLASDRRARGGDVSPQSPGADPVEAAAPVAPTETGAAAGTTADPIRKRVEGLMGRDVDLNLRWVGGGREQIETTEAIGRLRTRTGNNLHPTTLVFQRANPGATAYTPRIEVEGVTYYLRTTGVARNRPARLVQIEAGERAAGGFRRRWDQPMTAPGEGPASRAVASPPPTPPPPTAATRLLGDPEGFRRATTTNIVGVAEVGPYTYVRGEDGRTWSFNTDAVRRGEVNDNTVQVRSGTSQYTAPAFRRHLQALTGAREVSSDQSASGPVRASRAHPTAPAATEFRGGNVAPTGETAARVTPEAPRPETSPAVSRVGAAPVVRGDDDTSNRVRQVVNRLHGFSRNGYTTKINNGSQSGFSGQIIDDRTGNVVGSFTRNVQGGGDTIYHAIFTIQDEHRGSTERPGIGTPLVNEMFSAYKEAGFSKVKVSAGLDVGGYQWAKMGFEFTARDKAGAARELLMEQRYKLRQAVQEGNAAQPLLDEFERQVEDGMFTSPNQLSQVGKRTPWTYTDRAGKEHQMWLGKWMLLGAGWSGTYDLSKHRG